MSRSTGTGPRRGRLRRSLDEGPFVSPLGSLPFAHGPAGNVSSAAREVVTIAHGVGCQTA